MPRGFRQAAFATLAGTGDADIAVEAGAVLRPEDHLAAVTAAQGVGMNTGIAIHVGGVGLVQRPGTLEVTADQHLAAAAGARCVDAGAVEQADILAGQGHVAAAFPRVAPGCVEAAAVDHGPVVAAVEADDAVALLQAGGFDDAAVVHHLVEHRVAGPSREHYAATIGLQ